MANQTQKYAQAKLEAAQENVSPYGIDLGLRGIQHNTIATIDRDDDQPNIITPQNSSSHRAAASRSAQKVHCSNNYYKHR